MACAPIIGDSRSRRPPREKMPAIAGRVAEPWRHPAVEVLGYA
jgi:hypothetical protein